MFVEFQCLLEVLDDVTLLEIAQEFVTLASHEDLVGLFDRAYELLRYLQFLHFHYVDLGEAETRPVISRIRLQLDLTFSFVEVAPLLMFVTTLLATLVLLIKVV